MLLALRSLWEATDVIPPPPPPPPPTVQAGGRWIRRHHRFNWPMSKEDEEEWEALLTLLATGSITLAEFEAIAAV